MDLYELLNKLNINYEIVTHKPVYTVEEAMFTKDMINGIGCKNLFLTDKKDYFLVFMRDDKHISIKDIGALVNKKHLSFAPLTDLENILGVSEGSVTPLGIINDKDKKVTLILEKELINKRVLCHPLENTKTMSIEFNDLIKFIEYLENKYILF